MMHIQSGTHRGRRLLPPPKSAITRPITSSVKKSLFGMLAGHLPGATVADLFCGTGTLGLEALSNGAGHCIFAERSPAVVDRLRRNIETLDVVKQTTVWAGDVMRSLSRRLGKLDAPLDVVFVDPPYAQSRQWDWPRITRQLFGPLAEHLADDGIVVLRAEVHVERPETLAGLTVVREKTFGGMALSMLAKADKEADGA